MATIADREEVLKMVGATYQCGAKAAIPGAWDLGGWCPPEKALHIFDLIQELGAKFNQPLRCVELGVYEGKSMYPAAWSLKMLPAGGKITGIDPYTADACCEGFDTGDRSQREHVIWWAGSSNLQTAEKRCRAEIIARGLSEHCQVLTRMPDEIAGEFADLHFLHIDDCHSPTASLRNAQTWAPKLVPGGFLVLDDAHWTTMQSARRWIAERMDRIAERVSEGAQWEAYKQREKP